MYRGRGPAGEAVLVMMPAREQPSPSLLERFEREYTLRGELDAAWALVPLAVIPGRALILADPGSAPLDPPRHGPWRTAEFLRLATAMAGSLACVHARGLVHKDLKPANVFVEESTGAVQLTGFGLATRLPRERATRAPDVITGTPAYMAPEQTGRVNRSVDSRSDLYSLGVTFYEMLTGSLPFVAGALSEWIHCHVARLPPPLAERAPDVPEQLAAIVLKLLRKNAEERYQTAAGLAADLQRALDEWQSDGRISTFTLGPNDAPGRLQIPERLYGRERETSSLLEGFERVATAGDPELVLISGSPGIGKSSLVYDLQHVFVSAGALFAAGKFEQHQPGLPYATIADALRMIVRKLLLEPEAQVTPYRASLAAALGGNGRLVIELVPELELVIGPQPEVPELASREAQHRLHTVLARFLRVFATPEQPLVLFLDDLERLDAASWRFVESLLASADTRCVLFVGAYRANEVGPGHPLVATVEAVRHAGVAVHEIVLEPLGRDAVEAFVADALSWDRAHTAPLAELVHEKTAGNPFFVVQFLTALSDERLLEYDAQARSWRWDLDVIRGRSFTDNVVQLMLAKLRRLPPETRDALQLLACLGNDVSGSKLAAVLGTAPAVVQAGLWPALEGNLVMRIDDRYRFAHDRVQETAYALLRADARPAEHLRIARRLLSSAPNPYDDPFELADQFNRALELLEAPEERALVGRLNAQAGRKARAAGAYASACEYLERAYSLLPPEAWDAEHARAFALTRDLAECLYVAGEFERAEVLVEVLLERARDDSQRASAQRLRTTNYQVVGRHEDAVRIGLQTLALFGVSFPTSEEELGSAVDAELQAIATNLRGRAVLDLVDAPLASDPSARAAIGLLADVLAAAYNAKSRLFPLLILQGVNYSLRHGNTEESCLAYAFHAPFQMARSGDVQSAWEYMELSLRLNERLKDKKLRGRLLYMYAAAVNYRRHHFRTGLPILDEGFAAALDVGDLAYAAYISIISVWHHFECEEPLERMFDAALRYESFLKQTRNENVHELLRQYQQFVSCLQGATRGPVSFDDDHFDEQACVALFARSGYGVGITIHEVLKLIAAFTHERFDEALEHAEVAAARLDEIMFSATETTQVFYHALALAAAHDDAGEERRAQLRLALLEKLRRLELWARGCPENYAHRRDLALAELARIERRDLEAMRLYEQAIEGALRNGFAQKASLASELAARFYRSRDFETIADTYLARARTGYLRWGARAKVQLLDLRHPGLSGVARGDQATIVGAPLAAVDLSDVIDASRAVSDELVLERLIERLLTIVVDHAGAERGLLLLSRDGRLELQAEAVTRREGVQVQLLRTEPSGDYLPASLLRYVERSRQGVLLDHAAARGLFSADDYVRRRRSKSILCLPLLKQGRLVGVLYLENGLTPGAFTPERVTTLNVLASQAAVSLEAAELYARLQADVRERERSERALRASEQRFAKAFHDNPTPMAVIRVRDGAFVDVNDSLLRVLQRPREELVGHSAAELGPAFGELVDKLRRLDAQSAQAQGEELAIGVRGGEPRFLLVSNATIELEGERCFLTSLTDVTERKLVEGQLRQAQKMDAIGSLAGGIAHDFNNLLTLINGNSELAMMSLGSGDPSYDLVRAIFEAGQRAADLTRKLLAFSRKELLEPKVWNVAAIVADMEAILRRLIPENVSLETALAPDTGAIRADRGQIEQVILNLSVNSRDAMPRGGKLRIETANVVLGPARHDTLLEAADGPYVMLSVSDTGSGMTEAVKARAFEPFFSTKELGKGTGLGLAVVYGIVKQSGGNLSVSSEPGRGTAIRVYFPRVAMDETEAEPPEQPRARLARGQETVLLVEDEAEVRRFVARALESQGYRVLQAENGAAALELLEGTASRIDLVIADMVMPEMGGRELGAHLRQRIAGLPVLYVSGYVKDLDQQLELLGDGEYFLAKPFGPADLARKVRELLDDRRRYPPAPAPDSSGASRR